MTTPTQGIVLFAHGSRDPLWRAPIEAVEAHIRAHHPGVAVRCAYLELTTPDLPQAVKDLVDQGATAVTIVPMFLGTGTHARICPCSWPNCGHAPPACKCMYRRPLAKTRA